jgi:hypothetical protein
LKAAITTTYVALSLSVTLLLLSSDSYKSSLGQVQQQFQNYQNPTLGISIRHPSDWRIDEIRPNAINLYIQKGIVYVSISSDELDSPMSSATSADLNAQLVEYVSSQIDDRRENKEDFTLMESGPVTITGNSPAHKALYTFIKGEEETNPGETNKVYRIWTIVGDKAYTIAYVSEPNQYDQFLPTFQRMVDSFSIDAGDSSTTQIQRSDSNGEDNDEGEPNNGDGNCDRVSYPDPDVCIPPFPPDLNCDDVNYKNFKVTGNDPHRFDGDNDGIGCDSADGGGGGPPGNGNGNCDPSYPKVCIKSPPPNLNCPDIPHKNFQVTGSDPHGFDRDNDGIGCESANGEDKPTPMPGPGNGDGCVEVNGYLLSEGSYLDERGRIVGSPCNPEEFCSDPDSTDPTVIDHCSDGWEEIYERCWDGTFVESVEDCPPESEPIGYCNPGLRIIDGICGPYVPGESYCQALGCPGSPPDPSRPVTRTLTPPVTPTPEPTPTTPTPTPTPVSPIPTPTEPDPTQTPQPPTPSANMIQNEAEDEITEEVPNGLTDEEEPEGEPQEEDSNPEDSGGDGDRDGGNNDVEE